MTPAVTTDPNSGIPFGENPLNDADWTKNLSLDGAPNFNGVTVSVEELKTLPLNGYMALNREDEGYSIKGTSEEYDAEEEIDRDIQDYCVTGEEGNYYQIGSYATDGSYAMMLNEDIAKEVAEVDAAITTLPDSRKAVVSYEVAQLIIHGGKDEV